MAKRVSDETKIYVAEMLEKGCTYKQISQDLGVSNMVIADIKREFFGVDKMRNATVAGNKFDGLLLRTNTNKFVGTCRVKGGKFEKKVFVANNARDAIAMWEEWKEPIVEENKPAIYNPPIEIAPVRTKNIEHNEKENLEVIVMPKTEKTETAETIYILAFGNPKVPNYFTDLNEGKKVAELLNYALHYADVDTNGLKYNVIGVEPYSQKVE